MNATAYKTIAIINEPHKIYLVQNQQNQKIYIKKILDVYNRKIYDFLRSTHIPGIPQVLHVQEQDQTLIVIEEYISGTPLQELLDDSTVTESDFCNYMCELCEILTQLHSQNPPMVHRDIKPANIIITPCNHAVLIDFNAAKYLTDKNMTDTVLLGTKGYAAPEQYGFGSSTPQTDIYALGILMKEYAMLYGISSAPFLQLIDKCTQINPSDRYGSVLELKHEMEKFKSPKSASDLTKKPTAYLPPGFRTHTPWKILVALLCYLMIFYISLTLEVKNVYGASLWIQRLFCLIMLLVLILGTFNYRNMWKIIPLCRNKSPMTRFFGVLLLDASMVLSLMIIMVILLSLL